jgi:lipoprotein signal peptidase
MKSVKTIFATIALSAVSLTSAVASTTPGGVDTSLTYNSGILVLAFAGFLALVVVVQTIPAAITLYSMIKAAAETSKQQVAAKATSRN